MLDPPAGGMPEPRPHTLPGNPRQRRTVPPLCFSTGSPICGCSNDTLHLVRPSGMCVAFDCISHPLSASSIIPTTRLCWQCPHTFTAPTVNPALASQRRDGGENVWNPPIHEPSVSACLPSHEPWSNGLQLPRPHNAHGPPSCNAECSGEAIQGTWTTHRLH